MKYGDWKIIDTIRPDLNGRSIYLVKRDGDSTRYALKLESPGCIEGIVDLLDGYEHPNVLKLIDYDPAFTVCEYCDKGTLRDFDFTGWSDEEKLNFCFQVFDGMEFIHRRGFNKHDNDPKNILIKDGNIPVIADLESLQKIEKRDHLGGDMNSIVPLFYKIIINKQCLLKLERKKEQYNANPCGVNQ